MSPDTIQPGQRGNGRDQHRHLDRSFPKERVISIMLVVGPTLPRPNRCRDHTDPAQPWHANPVGNFNETGQWVGSGSDDPQSWHDDRTAPYWDLSDEGKEKFLEAFPHLGDPPEQRLDAGNSEGWVWDPEMESGDLQYVGGDSGVGGFIPKGAGGVRRATTDAETEADAGPLPGEEGYAAAEGRVEWWQEGPRGAAYESEEATRAAQRDFFDDHGFFLSNQSPENWSSGEQEPFTTWEDPRLAPSLTSEWSTQQWQEFFWAFPNMYTAESGYMGGRGWGYIDEIGEPRQNVQVLTE